jgi:hypothetical protein
MKKPHLRLHVRPGTHAGPWWWLEYPDGATTGYYHDTRILGVAAAAWIAARYLEERL